MTPDTLLSARLERARRARFVGRAAEIELFRTALLADEPPFVVLHIVGPGGVGKTSLLREFERVAGEQGRPVTRVDGRDIDPSPQCFRDVLNANFGATQPGGVLFIDTYEALAPLDRWLRESFLPLLPARSLVVIAGRNEPASAWRTDLEWAGLTRIVSLRGLHPDESRAFLNARGIDTARQDEVVAYTHGHPLALSLLADVLGQSRSPVALAGQAAPDVVRVLLERFVQDVPGPAYRKALAVCAMTLATTEALLVETLGVDAAHECFEWLRRLSFIDEGAFGLYPHDLARDVLDADFRWRDPAAHGKLQGRLLGYFQRRQSPEQSDRAGRARLEWFFLLRFLPFMAQHFDWDAMESAYAEAATPAESDAILAIVRAHEGDESAQIAAYWLRRQPQAFLAFRNSEHALVGFMVQLALHEATAADLAADPGVAQIMRFVQQHEPARPGEEVSVLRFWAHRQRYQETTAVINLTAINCINHWMTHARLSWSFTAMSDPAWWQPHFDGLNFARAPEADFTIGARRYGVFAHDWRVEPFARWPRQTVESFEAAAAVNTPPAPAAPPTITLSQAEFADAVRRALRDYTRPDSLAADPLIQMRLVESRSDELLRRPATLQTLLHEAAASLTANPKDEKLYRALRHTYFEPAPTQERAAELLDLPFSTYRYHLTGGIERVVAWLWQRENS